MTTPDNGIERIRRLAHRAERRIRYRRTLHLGSAALCAAIAAAVVVVALRKLGIVPESVARVSLAFTAAAFVSMLVAAWAWRLPRQAGAHALDRFHGLHDRLASALAFAERPEPERTPFMRAAMDDAASAAPRAEPARAVPIGIPKALGGAAALGALLACVLLFEVRKHVPAVHASTIDPVEMAADDLDDVKDFIRQLQQREHSDETRAAIEEFNKLVDDIANRRLDRTEAFRRMEALEQKHLTGSEASKEALEAQLEHIGEELKKADLTRPSGEAMAPSKLNQAQESLRQLAKQLRAHGGDVDKKKLDQMREALKKAATDAERRQHDLEQRRQELADEILKRKQQLQDKPDGGSEEEQSLLRNKERELERLDRDLEQQHGAGRQLDRLDRELQQAAEDLMKDMGLSAQDLEQGADDIHHIEQQQMTEAQKEELRQKLEELRQLMRQQGQGGKSRIVRLQRFGRMARGQGSGGQGQQGQGQQSEGQQPGEGQPSQGQGDQQGQAPGQGAQAGQAGLGSGETWIAGPNGEKILMLSKSSGSGQGSGGEGQGQAGRRWGEGHDPKVQGAATSAKMGTEDTQVQGSDTGQGASRSQVILGAAERGFSSRGYQKVYTEYHQVAEESLAQDEIPGGYRFYVKRYFQLIRPRQP